MTVIDSRGSAAGYRFGRFELLPAERILRVDGQPSRLNPRAFDVLIALVERSGRLVSKNELLELVWPTLIVEENNVEVQISALRKLLGPQAIATVPGRGYQFTLLANETDSHAAPREDRVEQTALPRGNLPAQLPPLYGRINEVVALTRLFERHRLVSVVGPGGIGKTRVALAVAHGLRGRYADGVWIIELASLSDPSLVVPTVARVLGQGAVGSAAALVEALSGQQLLLVLDNCEHLLDGIAAPISQIVARAPGVRLLITSQEPLHLSEEQVNRLNALAVPDVHDLASALSFGAVELFVARAQAADPRFRLTTENVADVIEICTRLDGIALAIELAAARVPLLGVHGIRQRLHERFKLLASAGARISVPRHQTLRAALEWSYALLSVEQQTVFDRLGVFVGSFSLEAAQQVALDQTIDAWTVLDHLAALVDKSLVIVDEGDLVRYRLLESSRALALERLAQAGVIETIRSRHAQAIADTLAANDALEGPQARTQRIGPDLDNVRAAAIWATGPTGDRQIAIALAGATTLLWDGQGCNDEGDRLYRKVELWVDSNTPLRLAARFWDAVGDLRLFIRLQHQAEAALRAAEMYRILDDQNGIFRALMSAAEKFSYLGDPVAADQALTRARPLLDPAWPLWMQSFYEQRLGVFEFFANRRPEAARLHASATLELSRRAGERYMEDIAELMLLMSDYALGNFGNAVRRGREYLQRQSPREGAWRLSIIMATLGAALTGLGRLEEAEARLREALPRLKHATGSASWAVNHVCFLLARQARLEDAARLIGYIDTPHRAQTIVQSPSQRRSYDEAVAILRTALDSCRFEQLRAAGSGFTEDEAIALAFR
jgi:predicted ATPase/DNA-binding winged helix-turn-helix (wHTH) protein